MIKTKDILGMEVPVYEGTNNASSVKIVAPGCDLGFRKPIKSKEFIDISEDLAMKLIRCIPQRKELLCGDIFLSGNYPSPDIEMRIKLNAFHCVARVTPYTKEEIYNQVISKNEDPSGKAITCGEIQLVMDLGKNLSPVVMYSPIRLNCETISIIFTGNFFQMPNAYARMFRERGRTYKDILAPLVNAMDNMYLRALTSWVAIQTMLLNPVIAIRFKRTSIPDDSTKVIKKGKKQPKRYVKKITIDDLSDLEFGETKGKHNIKEPFWWVSGQWREYKSGKKIFIEGYWKGPFREYGRVDEPREREIVFDTDIDAFKKILDNM